jgi:hypothetical protein
VGQRKREAVVGDYSGPELVGGPCLVIDRIGNRLLVEDQEGDRFTINLNRTGGRNVAGLPMSQGRPSRGEVKADRRARRSKAR